MPSDASFRSASVQTLETFDERFQEIINAYVSLGFSRELIAQWSLPEYDGRSLISHIQTVQPRKVLEVGTFVGEATLLMAAYLPAGAEIHTVDPNFPLERELGSMNSRAMMEDLEVLQQELARRVAQKLGLEHLITFHAGGFSTAKTFTSSKTDPRAIVPIIGPEVCKTHGPFDLIFIDGLHYAEAVLSDVQLATRFLKDQGRLIVHDVFGMWGSNVRRAIFQFLEENPGFRFTHGQYADVTDSIGVLQKSQAKEAQGETTSSSVTHPRLLEQEDFVSTIASMVVNICAPKKVVCLGSDSGGILSKLAERGVLDLHIISPTLNEAEMGSESNIRVISHSFESAFQPEEKSDLCILICTGREAHEGQLENLIESSVRCSRTILLGVTPPGEMGFGDGCGKPIAWWVRKFWKYRYRFHDVIRPGLEPLRFSYSLSPILPVESSELANLYLVCHEDSSLSDSNLLEQVLIEKERRIEDLSLQSVCADILLHDSLRKFEEAREQIERCGREITTYEQSVEYAIGYKIGKVFKTVPFLGRWINKLRSKRKKP